MKVGGLGPIILLGEVRAELKIGDPVDKAGGGGNRAVFGGKLDGGTGAVGIMGKGDLGSS